jgi:lipopolysaccharide export LptBFGC system permease protein LptF
MSDETRRLPGALLHKVLKRVGLVLALGRLGVRSASSARERWLGPALALSIASGLFTFGLYAWVTPEANQSYRERMVRRAGVWSEPIPKGPRELTLGELQTQIRAGHGEGRSIAGLDVEWHKRWAIPAACLLFRPLAIGLHGLWKGPRLAPNLAPALAATLLLYNALRLGEQAALHARLGPLPAIWAGNVLLALVTTWLLARRPSLRAVPS